MHVTFTFTSASSNVNNYSQLPVLLKEGPTGRSDAGHQVLRVSATANNSGGSATLQIVEVDRATSSVVWREDLTVSHPSTVRRTGYDNASGNYVMNVTAATSGNHYVDIGAVPPSSMLLIGCISLTTITSLAVRIQASRNA